MRQKQKKTVQDIRLIRSYQLLAFQASLGTQMLMLTNWYLENNLVSHHDKGLWKTHQSPMGIL